MVISSATNEDDMPRFDISDYDPEVWKRKHEPAPVHEEVAESVNDDRGSYEEYARCPFCEAIFQTYPVESIPSKLEQRISGVQGKVRVRKGGYSKWIDAAVVRERMDKQSG